VPVVDLPLDHLRAYEGRNPKPADFDAFWDAGLKEIEGLDTTSQHTNAEFQVSFATCEHLVYRGLGNAQIYTKLIRPKNPNGGAVICFHGYSAASADWSSYLGWTAAGFTVAAMDCRGQGGRSEDVGGVRGPTQSGLIIRGLDDAPEKLYYRSVFLDTAILARVVMRLDGVDPHRVSATGGSQGGGLALACAALEPRIHRTAPWYPFLCDYRRVWEMDLDVAAYDELRKFFRHFDPRHEREEEIFNRLGYIDVQHLAPRIRAQTLMSIGLIDTITPPSTCFAAFNKIMAPKEVVIYPDFGHEGLPGFSDRVFQFITAP
jgi:cephalosporin-C deacetylase